MSGRNNYNKNLSILLYYCDDNYRSTHQHIGRMLDNIDFHSLLEMAKANKMVLFLCQKISILTPHLISKEIAEILENGDKCLAKLKRTLIWLSEAMRKKKLAYILVKTNKNIPYLTEDIDVFIKKNDYRNFVNLLKESYFSEMKVSFFSKIIVWLRLDTSHFSRNDFLNIDPYPGMPWAELEGLDEEFIMSASRFVTMEGLNCAIPSFEADLLAIIINIFFTSSKITFLDFVYICCLFDNKLDYAKVDSQLDKYGWKREFEILKAKILALKERIHNEKYCPSDIKFPFIVPFSLVPKLPLIINIGKKPGLSLLIISSFGFRCLFGRIYSFLTGQNKNY